MNFLLVYNFTNLSVQFAEFRTLCLPLLNSPTFAAMVKVFFDGEVFNLELPVVAK